MKQPDDSASDLALETLLSVAEEISQEIPADLIRRVYFLQKSRQFDSNRELALQELQRVLDDYCRTLDPPSGSTP